VDGILANHRRYFIGNTAEDQPVAMIFQVGGNESSWFQNGYNTLEAPGRKGLENQCFI
jgi:hypothetical protein